MSHRPSFWFSLLGLGFAGAGLGKLLDQRGYERLFHRWGWSAKDMQLVGAAELAGALLVTNRATRRLGGVVLAATSGAVLYAELQHDDSDLAVARTAMLGAALTAVLAPGSCRC